MTRRFYSISDVYLLWNWFINFVPAVTQDAILTLFTYFLGFDIPTYAIISIENVFYYS